MKKQYIQGIVAVGLIGTGISLLAWNYGDLCIYLGLVAWGSWIIRKNFPT
jgi:hypothetical protein